MAKRRSEESRYGFKYVEDVLKPVKFRNDDRLVVSTAKEMDEFVVQVVGDNMSRWPSSQALAWIERFPVKHEGGLRGLSNSWTVPATDIAAQLIALWPKEQVRFSPESEVVFTYLIGTCAIQKVAMDRAARYHEYVSARPLVHKYAYVTPKLDLPDYPVGEGGHLMLHQRLGVANSVGSEAMGLWMEPGTGKTLVVIKRVDEECKAQRDRMYLTLIVCPKNVLSNWAIEFRRFSTEVGHCTLLRGGGDIERFKLLMDALVPSTVDQRYSVVITSYECMSNSIAFLKTVPWDLIVLDEAHFIKWHETKRAKTAVEELRDSARARMELTGTPVCNTPMDTYTQFEFLRKGGSGFNSFHAFRKFYGVFQVTDATRKMRRLVDVRNLPFMRERIARMCIVVRKEEAMPDLPSKVYDQWDVEMTSDQREIYDKLSSELWVQIENDLNDETKTINANNILTRLLRLAQITSGFVAFDPIQDLDTGEIISARTVEHFDPNPKLDALMELIADKEDDQKTIVSCIFVADIHAVTKRLRDAGHDVVVFYGATKDADREEAVRRFNGDPSCKYMVLNPVAGGIGLNLLGYNYWDDQAEWVDTNCDHIIVYSQGWSNPVRAQLEDRANRRGTRVRTRITDLCCPDTIDEEIRARVVNKRISAIQVQDLREILHRVLRRKS